MGYWKDNFPGSAAYFQRIRIARGVVVYSLVCGGLLLAFSPFANTLRKEFEERPPEHPEWIKEKGARRMGEHILTGIPQKDSFDKILKTVDQELHMDWTRPAKLQQELLDKETSERTGKKPAAQQ